MQLFTIIGGSLKTFVRSFFVLGFLQWFHFWFVSSGDCEISIDGLTMLIRGGSLNRKVVGLFVALYCLIDRQYTPKGYEIGEADTVFDIGGHIGSFTLLAARQALKGKVYVFEPDRVNFEILSHNVGRNQFQNVTVINEAVGSRSEEKIFYRNRLNDSSSSFTRVVGTGVSVRITSLKDVFERCRIERVDFMKMDCEGSEYDIIFNTPDDVLRRIPKMAIEVHNARYFNLSPESNNLKKLVSRLESLGFKTRVVKETSLHDLVFASLPV